LASFCLEGGILSGKYLGGPSSGRAAVVLDQPRFAPAVAAAPALTAFASRVAAMPAAVALAFPLSSRAVAIVLFGATSAQQVLANCAAVGLLRQLSRQELAELRQVGAGAAAD
jgi:aryl-alcohol dehydrogenase-like predicted oxidoreductase